ncbi:endonuclease domain-containing protein [Xanthomonas euvesicatoria pv. euvesicatoria]|uniref:endonuclease domain-containing protein n=1 Tax=Xanthomonas TaxID=338 RepID=UPI00080E53B6|nr:endonuclease domain-containing protein [Xanthomonas euvesicatoria]MBV6686855.1 endonuclease domain-containing protein [Xanthomonas euvesicatoria pv. physalidis]MBV6792361.1 endonuclease domain-containing protein [Xanthomonas campestris pv. daturae]MBV6845022.1 endonuclease domain-containing protein [Xanthomonas campestris pv. paulliniae]OCG93527.1 DNA methyltransferase [Xanthomonas euvesicatoria]
MRTGEKIRFAKTLRREMTAAERLLWYRLRDRRLLGCKFRRQYPVGPYVADFACLERALIVELDGSQHLDASSDAAREAFLHRKGFQLLRFWNNEVLVRTDAVCDAIAQRLCVARFSLPPSGVR